MSNKDLRTPQKLKKIDDCMTKSNSSYVKDKIDSSHSQYTDSANKSHRNNKVEIKGFSLSNPDVKDYNNNKREPIVADRFIPIRKNNRTSLAFSDVMDDEAYKENFAMDSPGLTGSTLSRSNTDKEDGGCNALNSYLKTHILGLQNDLVKSYSSEGFGQNMLSFQLHLEKRDPLMMLMPET